MDYKTYSHCRLCKSTEVQNVLDFGETALANSFRSDKSSKIDKFPLSVNLCLACGCVQLKDSVSPEALFSNYLYSSTRSGLSKYFKQYARHVLQYFQFNEIRKRKTVLEIGSNDGVLLKEFADLGLEVIGVEPAKNLAEEANSKGLKTINAFFNKELASTIYKTIDLIVANNVFAHIDDIDSVINGVKLLMDRNPNCVFVFENAYWPDTARILSFDQIYHEHIFYHCVSPLQKYFLSNGLKIVEVEKTSNQGGSIRCFVCKLENSSLGNHRSILSNADLLIQNEISSGIFTLDFYKDLSNKINKLKNKISKIKGKVSLSVYGAPAKLTTLCSGLGLDESHIQYVVDDSDLKQCKFLPFGDVPIVSSDFFKKNPTDVCLISAWNFADKIKQNNNFYEGVWINPIDI